MLRSECLRAGGGGTWSTLDSPVRSPSRPSASFDAGRSARYPAGRGGSGLIVSRHRDEGGVQHHDLRCRGAAEGPGRDLQGRRGGGPFVVDHAGGRRPARSSGHARRSAWTLRGSSGRRTSGATSTRTSSTKGSARSSTELRPRPGSQHPACAKLGNDTQRRKRPHPRSRSLLVLSCDARVVLGLAAARRAARLRSNSPNRPDHVSCPTTEALLVPVAYARDGAWNTQLEEGLVGERLTGGPVVRQAEQVGRRAPGGREKRLLTVVEGQPRPGHLGGEPVFGPRVVELTKGQTRQ